MYIYFEDWTGRKDILEQKGIPQDRIGSHFIKAFTSNTDPNDLGYSAHIEEYGGAPFPWQSEYDFGPRGRYPGGNFEYVIAGKRLPEEQQREVRALLRFGLDKRVRYTQRIMEAVVNGAYFRSHPVDSIELHVDKKSGLVIPHIDFFSPESLSALFRIGVHEGMLKPQEGVHFRRGIPKSQLEGNRQARR